VLCKIPEECWSHLRHGGSLKSHRVECFHSLAGVEWVLERKLSRKVDRNKWTGDMASLVRWLRPVRFDVLWPCIINVFFQVQPTRCNVIQYSLLLWMLYMFWVVAASEPGTYQMLCVQFLSSWWWAEKLPETCRAFTVVKNIV